MPRSGTYSSYWQNVPLWSRPVGEALAFVDLTDVARAGGKATLPALTGNVSLVAGTDLTLNGAVRASGKALTGSWKRGDIIQHVDSRTAVEVALDDSVMDCANGVLYLVKGYTGKMSDGQIPPGNGTLDCGAEPGVIAGFFVLAICNSNSAKDDNFSVILNGRSLGNIDLSENAQVGDVWVNDSRVNLVNAQVTICPVDNLRFKRTQLIIYPNRTNVLEMKNVQENDNGNYGSIELFEGRYSNGVIGRARSILSTFYSGTTGEDFRFEFGYDPNADLAP